MLPPHSVVNLDMKGRWRWKEAGLPGEEKRPQPATACSGRQDEAAINLDCVERWRCWAVCCSSLWHLACYRWREWGQSRLPEAESGLDHGCGRGKEQ